MVCRQQGATSEKQTAEATWNLIFWLFLLVGPQTDSPQLRDIPTESNPILAFNDELSPPQIYCMLCLDLNSEHT